MKVVETLKRTRDYERGAVSVSCDCGAVVVEAEAGLTQWNMRYCSACRCEVSVGIVPESVDRWEVAREARRKAAAGVQ